MTTAELIEINDKLESKIFSLYFEIGRLEGKVEMLTREKQSNQPKPARYTGSKVIPMFPKKENQ